MAIVSISEAVKLLQNGEVVAYPTESVFGLGCAISAQQSVEKIFLLKQRPPSKTLLLVSSSIEDIKKLIHDPNGVFIERIKASYGTRVTWLAPASVSVPENLVLDGRVAIRYSSHPVIAALTEKVGPITSTSANIHGKAPCTNSDQIQQTFPTLHVIEGCADGGSVSTIVDIQTDVVLRGNQDANKSS